MYAWTEGGYVPKCTTVYSQGGRSKMSTFCVRNTPKKSSTETCKTFKTFVIKLII